MVKQYSIEEAGNDLLSVVREAESGVRVELVRGDRPVALILGFHATQETSGALRSFRDVYEEFRQTHDLMSDPIDPDEVFARDDAASETKTRRPSSRRPT
jgi:antitoxin (DNA-binding transcriptional repressor) of toxin-antitoxin stability system